MPSFDPPLTPVEVRNAFGTRVIVHTPLATGGQANLFTVEFQSKRAALKIYSNAYEARAERECQALERVQSDNIVKLLKWGRVDLRGNKCIYTIAEFVEGETLREHIQRGRMDEQTVRRLGVDIVTAIQKLWQSERIVHRDIKPENIMIRKMDGTAVILDLGIARHRNLPTITIWGITLGTEGYMSPEQARGRRGITYKSDFFSLGIVLYEAMTQIHPFHQNQNLIVTAAITPTPLRQLVGASETLSRTVASMLMMDPLDRPRNCEHLIATLQRN